MRQHPTALYRVFTALSTATIQLHHRPIIPVCPFLFKGQVVLGVRSHGISSGGVESNAQHRLFAFPASNYGRGIHSPRPQAAGWKLKKRERKRCV